jgi:hypothetical protein
MPLACANVRNVGPNRVRAKLGREISPRRRRMVLAGCVLASAMAFIDGSVLTVAAISC